MAAAGGHAALRALAGWFEIANVDERMAGWAGTPADPPFALGALAIAWPRLHRARDGQELRAALAASPWGDPGGTDARTIGLHMRAAWARRVGVHVPSARSWAAGGVALLVARERHVLGRLLPAAAAATAARSIGRTAAGAPSWPSFVAALPGPARWVFEPGDGPGELWRAEARWWRRVHADAAALLAAPRRASTGSSARQCCSPWTRSRYGRRWPPPCGAAVRSWSMRWREAFAAVPMTRVAVVAPAELLRTALVRVADAGCLDIDRLVPAADQPAASAAQALQRLALPDSPEARLLETPPDIATLVEERRATCSRGDAVGGPQCPGRRSRRCGGPARLGADRDATHPRGKAATGRRHRGHPAAPRGVLPSTVVDRPGPGRTFAPW
ncbi:hypothetical protein ACFQX7_29575 [Luedemannella flava]